jgi:hypothetical protein
MTSIQHFFKSLEENLVEYVIPEQGLKKYAECFEILAFEKDLQFGMQSQSDMSVTFTGAGFARHSLVFEMWEDTNFLK